MLHMIKLLCEETREGHFGSCRDGQSSRRGRHVEVEMEVEAASMCRTQIGMRGSTKKVKCFQSTDHRRFFRFTVVPSLNSPLLVTPMQVPHVLYLRQSTP